MAFSQSVRAHRILHILVVALCLSTLHVGYANDWLNHGRDITNRRYAAAEFLISPKTVPNKLQVKWKFLAGKDVSATPAVAGNVVYFPSWNGNLYAVDANSGGLVWQKNLTQLTGLTPTGQVVNVTVSRSTPTVYGNLLIVGIYGPAVMIAVNRQTGNLVWLTEIDPRPRAQITQSGTAFLGGFYVGVSSLEENLPASQCCTFRGSLLKLDILTGKIIWQTFTLPDNRGELGGYSGGAIWGSSPSIDIIRNLVYVGTGNLYNAPADVLACQAKQNNQTTQATNPDQCTAPNAYFNSILAIDTNTGNIKWGKKLGGYDVFYFVCLTPNNPDCPPGPNLDADFGEAPMLVQINNKGKLRDVVVAVQKSGFAWALDRDTGDIVWSKLAGPGGKEGGGSWGAATDGKKVVYTNIVNNNKSPFRLAPSNDYTTAGGWVALNASSGEILWTTANPSNVSASGPVTLANGVLFAGSVAPNGPVYAMDASTGKIIWSYNTGASVYGGASVSHGCVYIGSGYSVGLARLFHPTWTTGTLVYAFCVT